MKYCNLEDFCVVIDLQFREGNSDGINFQNLPFLPSLYHSMVLENPEITEENPEWLQFAYTFVQETADNKT